MPRSPAGAGVGSARRAGAADARTRLGLRGTTVAPPRDMHPPWTTTLAGGRGRALLGPLALVAGCALAAPETPAPRARRSDAAGEATPGDPRSRPADGADDQAPPDAAPTSPPPGTPPPAPEQPGAEAPPPSAPVRRRPVVLVHGITGSSADFASLVARLVADGWAPEQLVALDYADPAWGCNVDNAAQLRETVEALRARTGADQVDVVAHSMGSLGARWYVKELGGASVVRTYVSLGGMHRGLFTPCLSPLPVCVWRELCESGAFLAELNAAPAAPAPVRWWSIAGGADDTVEPARAVLEGATNVVVEGVTHVGLLDDERVYAQVRDALLAP